MGITVIRAANFVNSIGINTHMSYTDGAYASVANVQADLAFLGVTTIRDAVPNPNGGIPMAMQVSALDTLAKAGIRFDLLSFPNAITIGQTLQQIESLDSATPGAVLAIEGPNEINNWPVYYKGLTGQQAATAFQTDLYSAIKSTAATAGIAVYNFTGGLDRPVVVGGTMTRNAQGSYTLVSGQIGFQVTVPTGVSKITLTYQGQSSGSPVSGLCTFPGQGFQTGIISGSNGTISYSYNNTTSAAQRLYVDFADYNHTSTLTDVKVTGPGSTSNLVEFNPNLSLAGQANYANIHPYAANGGAILPGIAGTYQAAYGSPTPGPRVITETGYSTDPNATSGVSQAVQAQQIINGLLDAYQSGVSTTYLYELLDEKADPTSTNPEMHFGLFNNDSTPKLAAIALHNFTTFLADGGSNASSFTTGKLDYTATGAKAGDQSMLFEKSTGEFDIALWNDGFAGTKTSDSVLVKLDANYASVVVHDVVTGARAIYTNVSQITASLGADPLIVQIMPATVNVPARMNFAASAAATTSAAWFRTVPPASPTSKEGAFTPTTTSITSITGFLASLTSQAGHGAALVSAAAQHLQSP